MANLDTNLTRLATARTNIANAIVAKGGTVNTNDGFEDFVTDIGTIKTDFSTVYDPEFYINNTYTESIVINESEITTNNYWILSITLTFAASTGTSKRTLGGIYIPDEYSDVNSITIQKNGHSTQYFLFEKASKYSDPKCLYVISQNVSFYSGDTETLTGVILLNK